MKFSDLFLLSTRMFKARTSRTFLTILGMSVGIGAILFLVSLGYGLQNTLLEKITTSDSLLTLDVTEDRAQAAQLNSASVQKMKEINGVSDVSPAFQLDSQGKMEDLTTDLSVTVVDSLYLKLGGVKLSEGRLINDDEIDGVIISSSVAQIFGKSAGEIIGKLANLSFFMPENSNQSETGKARGKINTNESFKIIGVIESEDSVVYVNVKSFNGFEVSKFSQVKVKCQESKIMAGVQGQITDLGFSVSSLSETVDQANKIFRIVKIVLMLFGIIALVVSAIGMFNTMTIALLERTEEIGIMKSIGASDTMVSLMFIMEATIMGFLGGVVGIIIGWLEGRTFNLIVNLIATHFGGEKVNLFYSPFWFVSSIIIFSAVVGFLTGVIPARRASGVDPLEALRYK